MKLKTNYEAMTNEQLYTELLHRVSTFGDNLPTYVTGGEFIKIEGFESKRNPGTTLKGVWLGDFLDRDETDQAFTIIEDPINDEPYKEYLEIIEMNNSQYRDFLLRFLQCHFHHIEVGQTYPQQEELAHLKCIYCNDPDHRLVNYAHVFENAPDVWEETDARN